MSLNLGNLRNAVRGLWEELVERRLWPVAIALLVAIVAVPVVMSKSAPQTTAPASATPAGGASPLTAFQPAVTTEGRKSSQIRKNLRRFGTKNPFTPKGATFAGSSAAGTATVTSGATGAAGVAATVSGGTDTGSSTGAGSSPVPSTTSPTSGSTGDGTGVTYYTYTVDVRFGKTDSTQTMTLTKFRALPSSNDPIVVFMGVRNDGETAVFLVSADATTTGDGTCSPSDDACTFLYLKKGEQRMIESVGQDGAVVDYELKLRDVNVKKTKGPDKASSSGASRSIHKPRADFKRKLRSFENLGF